MIELRETLLSNEIVNKEMEKIFNEKLLCTMEMMLGLERENEEKIRLASGLHFLNEGMNVIIPKAENISFPVKVMWVMNLYKKLDTDDYFEPTEVEKFMMHMLFMKSAEIEKDCIKDGCELYSLPEKMLIEMIRFDGLEDEEIKAEDVLSLWKDTSMYPEFFFEDEDYLLLEFIPVEIVCKLGCNEM